MLFALLFACSGEPVEDEPKTCCTLDEVIEMCSAELSNELIISTVETATEPLELSAQDVIKLSEAGCSDAVINSLRGTPVDEVEEEIAEEAAPAAGKTEKKDQPPTVAMSVVQGALMMDVTNNTAGTLTNVRMTVNGSYFYTLSKITAHDTDSVRKGSFKSKDGVKFNGTADKIYISTDQGVYYQAL
ncbi:MAG: hypothetical protein GY913_16290 [Proteobacteria bacterium]|nr:hypothetical protein [Pseudomonadota bacterium]MCP4918464.1 hypothetical protein [Pseudomonadota bacterium]